MDLISLIQAIQGVPYVGPLVVYLPPLVLLGSVLAAVLPAPDAASTGWYRVLHAVVQWCALNKGQARSASTPPAPGKVPTAAPALLAMLVAGLVLTACAAAPQTARQGIYAAGSAYSAALRAAVAYASLPRCGQPASPPVCSDQTVVTQMDRGAQLAQPTVQAALTTAASTSASDTALSQALAAATQAVGAFQATIALIPQEKTP
jgi:hypothetical protein